MKKNQINIKQLCAIFLALMPITKIITAPSIFAGACNEKLWQPLLILFFADLCLIFLLFLITKKHEGKSFFQILYEVYNPTFAKAVFFIYAIFFFAKSILPLIEQKEFIENAFYETLPQAPIFYPAFIVIFYLCIKGFKTLGRTAQICTFASAIGILLILFLSFPTSNFKNLLPIFAFSNKSSAIAALNGLSWFNDAIYLFFFIGFCDLKKKDFKPLVISYSISAFVIVLFFLTFYAIFSYISRTQTLALTSMSIFGITLVNVGRFDYIALFLLAFSGIVAIALPFILSTKCLNLVFSLKKSWISALIVCLSAFLIIVFFGRKYEELYNFITKYLTPLFLICGYLLPLLALGGRKNEIQKG